MRQVQRGKKNSSPGGEKPQTREGEGRETKGKCCGERNGEGERKKAYVRKNVRTARVFELRELLVPVKKEPSFSVDGRSAPEEVRKGNCEEERQRATMFPSVGDKVVGRKNARKEKSKTYAAMRTESERKTREEKKKKERRKERIGEGRRPVA